MLVLITYDVSTVSSEGRTRLRKVSKLCVNYGQRVQNSVFECSIDPVQLVSIKHELNKIINHTEDNIRIYHLGKNWIRKVESLGRNDSYNPDTDILML
ncbi:MAG: CRISPR-associated endonuclease Cas2 [[Eubacterium] sulci]|nr:CRISPR-associated endonuclease Cas2 [[Eubacterium] sulci]MBF1168807.1 CRISPR-associated endonuclease Cas2 [[Eubacterium] sulci]